MRILWVANYSHNSSYALQSNLLVPALAQMGHEVAVLELASGGGKPRQINGVMVYQPYLDPMGHDMLEPLYRHIGADAVISFVDNWGFRPDVMSKVRWYPLTPVDTMPVAPKVVESSKSARIPFAISRYGQRMLKEAGFDNAGYMPCVYDRRIYYPRDKAASRAQLGMDEDAYIVSFVGVNNDVPSRKGIPELLMAWSEFHRSMRAQGRSAVLFLHTMRYGRRALGAQSGVDIPQLIKTLDLDPTSIKMPDDFKQILGIRSEDMAALYSASDLFILPTRGEGFGIPLVEAQACGTPVATTNFAAGRELVYSGCTIAYEPDWSWQSAFVAKPSVTSILEALEWGVEHRGDPAVRKQAVDGARQYALDLALRDYYAPMIDAIAADVLGSDG